MRVGFEVTSTRWVRSTLLKRLTSIFRSVGCVEPLCRFDGLGACQRMTEAALQDHSQGKTVLVRVVPRLTAAKKEWLPAHLAHMWLSTATT